MNMNRIAELLFLFGTLAIACAAEQIADLITMIF